MIMTTRGLRLEPGEGIVYLAATRVVDLRAQSPWDCDKCVLSSHGGCSRFVCTPSERGGAGVHFIEEGKEETA